MEPGPVWVNQGAGGLPGRAGGARREAGGLWSAGQEQGREGREEREREQREKDGIDSKFEFFSKISVET